MRALSANDSIRLNKKEYNSFVENIEGRKISKEREQELQRVSNRFSQAKKMHGRTKLVGISGNK